MGINKKIMEMKKEVEMAEELKQQEILRAEKAIAEKMASELKQWELDERTSELLKENNTMVEHVRVLETEKGSQNEIEKELRNVIEKHQVTIEKTEIENNKLKSEISLDQIKFKE